MKSATYAYYSCHHCKEASAELGSSGNALMAYTQHVFEIGREYRLSADSIPQTRGCLGCARVKYTLSMVALIRMIAVMLEISKDMTYHACFNLAIEGMLKRFSRR